VYDYTVKFILGRQSDAVSKGIEQLLGCVLSAMRVITHCSCWWWWTCIHCRLAAGSWPCGVQDKMPPTVEFVSIFFKYCFSLLPYRLTCRNRL